MHDGKVSVLRFSRARIRAGTAGMSPTRLQEESRLLYEALNEIWERETTRSLAGWNRQAGRLVGAVMIAALLCAGITVGVIMGTRRALSQTAAIINSQQVQIDLNARLIREQREKDQADGQDRRHLIELLSKAAQGLPREK